MTRENHQARGSQEQRSHNPGGPVQLLKVVQHEQGLAVAEVLGHHVGGGPGAADVQAVGEGLPHDLGIAHCY